jgi:uncharacterized protein
MFGGLFFTLGYPWIKELLGTDLGKIRITDFFDGYGLIITLILSAVLLTTAYLLPTIDYKDPADDR